MPFDPERLKEMRQRKGITQRELAELCGITDVQLSRYETGKMEPALSNLEAIADQLRVSVDFLLRRTDEPHKNYSDDQLDDNERVILETYRRESWPGVIRLGAGHLSK